MSRASNPVSWACINKKPIESKEAIPNYGSSNGSLSDALLKAIENFKERILSGLNGLTEEDIEKKIEEFTAMWKPVNGTEEELAAFEKKLADFKEMLNETATGEMLLTSGSLAESENNSIAGFKRAQIVANSPVLQNESSSLQIQNNSQGEQA